VEFIERALRFRCQDAALYGVLALPEQPAARGVLIVVGGAQYRAGSHRHFVLLARQLAQAGIPVLRFDYRGMGDSDGDSRGFEQVGDDIRAALDRFAIEVPAVREVVIFGLCDASCATLFYAHRDPRICGLVLANPWVRTSEGLAKTYLRHYYLARLLDRELWRKVASGRFGYREAARSFLRTLAGALAFRAGKPSEAMDAGGNRPLPERMLEGLRRFNGRVLFILSGNDLTAKEFLDMAEGSGEWRELLASPRVARRLLADANHTFSRRDWRDQLGRWMTEWLGSF